jgi:hypothetical protein
MQGGFDFSSDVQAGGRCPYCGGRLESLDHALTCDGQQGVVEALYGTQGDVPFEVGSDTSAAAARALDVGELGRLEALVLGIIIDGPRTCDAVEAVSGLTHQTASARLRGLVLRDQIVDSGRRELTRSGRRAVVWRVKTEAERGEG